MSISAEVLSAPPAETEEQEPKRFYGVTTGRVINLVDLMLLGRVQVQLPFIDDLDLSPWARIAVPMAGPATGVAFLPQLGDEVLVAFEQGDVNVPYIIGSLWNGLAPPPPNLPDPLSPVRTSYAIRTLAGNQIQIIETPPSIAIASPLAQQSMAMTNAGTAFLSATSVSITVAGTTIVVTPAGVQIAGTTISLTATTALNLAAPAINITASGDCAITGAMVLINT